MPEYKKIQQSLLIWFKKNKRDLPWRHHRSWYKVWVSEIMLQQTQVEQVKKYFHNFMSEFENVQKLANADLQKVLKIWEGMGYYGRARNMHKSARIIIDNYRGEIPANKNEILKLPGIGDYTANAILSLVYNSPLSVVDGNVKRVISRIFGLLNNIKDTSTLKEIKSFSEKLLPRNNPGEFNESIMELGALICLPNNPKCHSCPIKNYCQAFKNNLVNVIPFKSKRRKIPLIRAIAQITINNNKYFIAKRKDSGLLGGFWEFPLKTIKSKIELQQIAKDNLNININHSYTHFNIIIYPILVDLKNIEFDQSLYENKKWVKFETIQEYPIHKAMQKVVNILQKH